MQVAKLLHNPTAGEGLSSKKKLVSVIESAGIECSYSSTKEPGWEKFDSDKTDFIIVAGGDGTVRKVSKKILDQKLLKKKPPIGLLPVGTANNIANSLGISDSPKKVIKSWGRKTLAKFDVGRIYGLKDAHFFLESLGYGIFPRLIREMKKLNDKEKDTPEKKLKLAQEKLYDIIQKYEAKHYNIQVNKVDCSGEFLLVEVMNTPTIGPNLHLAPLAKPGDGELEVVLISEEQRNDFADYVARLIRGDKRPPMFNILKAKNLQISCDADKLHVDDELIALKKPIDLKIELLEGVLEFLVPDQQSTNQILEENMAGYG